MTMPASQQPEFEPQASYPAIRLAGGSGVPKVFQGNRIGVGWASFRNTDNWLIGGEGSDGNIVIAPRGGIWVQGTQRTVVRGNLAYHVYYGGWSQGNVMEVDGSDDLVIEHNVVGGGSWPIRSLGGTLRYNLVLDAGHQWLWVTGDDAAVHHNVFAGGDADVAGIWAIYGPQNVDIYNNTIDTLGRAGARPFQVEAGSSVSFRSNAIVTRDAPAVQVAGTLDADYNLFSGQAGTPRNYSDDRKPAHDVGALNAQVDPRFSEGPEPWRHAWEDLWTRRISVAQVLANYRERYRPAAGSPLVDAGEPSIAGNDIGAVGAGAPAGDDLFGLLGGGDLFADARLFAMQQYRDFLGREGDPAGIAYWAAQIDSGAMSRGQVIEAFFGSPEFQGAIAPVARLYFAYFLRIPDYGGLDFWIGYYRAGNPLEAISDFFAASAEFQARYGSLDNAAFVNLVYQNVLGRAPDAGGFAFWKGQLDTGSMTRGQVMLGFSESPEYRQSSESEVYVTMMYIGMLRRAPDPGGFAYWVGYRDAGNPGLALIDGFLASQEYRGRFE
jgi:hypothetical protein